MTFSEYQKGVMRTASKMCTATKENMRINGIMGAAGESGELVDLLKNTICTGEFNPFSGVLYSQNGVVQEDREETLTPEKIITMDWLCENVIGRIPKMSELTEHAIPVVMEQGISGEIE